MRIAVGSWRCDQSACSSFERTIFATALFVAGCVFTSVFASAAGGQCGEWSTRFKCSLGSPIDVRNLATWDPDGDGPKGSELIALGYYYNPPSEFNGLASFDGTRWAPFGSGLTGQTICATTWDRDGNGPNVGELIVGGAFTTATGVTYNNIASWDGSMWRPLGTGVTEHLPPDSFSNGVVYDVESWDPDGDGPEPAQLIAAGNFTKAGGQVVNCIARWDGERWHALGNGLAGLRPTVYALETWDPDGPGPARPLLIVGGSFAAARGARLNNIAAWDGESWRELGQGVRKNETNGTILPATVFELAKWDPDGNGPMLEQLVAGGSFDRAGETAAQNLARWDGVRWHEIGGGQVGSTILDLVVWNTDITAATPSRLLVISSVRSGTTSLPSKASIWDGVSWYVVPSTDHIYDATVWDPDGNGPMPALPIIAPQSFNCGGSDCDDTIMYLCDDDWCALTNCLHMPTTRTSRISTMVVWGPGGSGGDGLSVVAFGSFNLPMTDTFPDIMARWADGVWRPLHTGQIPSFGTLTPALLSWDPDGPGAQPPELLIAGGIEGSATSVCGRWNGSVWQTIGSGINGNVYALATWDPDGSGPLPEHVIAAGDFTSINGVSVSRVAAWDGSTWRPLGLGLNSTVRSLISWDPDGDGPLPAELVAGGEFTNSGLLSLAYMARWNGTSWRAIGGAGPTGTVRLLASWDHDGVAATGDRLIAIGDFLYAGSTLVKYMTQFDGTAWHPMGNVFNSIHAAVQVLDIDGDGQLPPQVFVGSRYLQPGMQQNHTLVYRWDGSSWHACDFGMGEGIVTTLDAWDPDGPGGEPASLLAGGAFSSVGGVPSELIAEWKANPGAGLDAAVLSGEYCSGGSATLSVVNPVPGATYQWRRNLIELRDGSTPHGSMIAGSGTASLLISSLRGADAGEYDVYSFSSCGRVSSSPVHLEVCAVDFNCDGRVDGDDILSFLTSWFDASPGSFCFGCIADWNRSNSVTNADLTDFVADWFAALSDEACP